jgi:hypothetical protein
MHTFMDDRICRELIHNFFYLVYVSDLNNNIGLLQDKMLLLFVGLRYFLYIMIID